MEQIDINCDVGEGMGNEARLMPLISSCNVSCGAHAGSEDEIRRTIQLAIAHDVKIGAHPSYPDRENFGRKVLDIPKNELQKSLRQQLESFIAIVKEEGGELHHIKPHGALYNQIAIDANLASIFLEVLEPYKTYPVYVPFNSEIEKKALKRGFKIIYEAFADRNYTSNLKLVPRKNSNAIITSPEEVLNHVLRMALNNEVLSIEGELKGIKAKTFCVHGDTDSALEILMYLNQELPNHQLTITK